MRRLRALAAVAFALAACSTSTRLTVGEPLPADAPPSPSRLTAVPEGYELGLAGKGTDGPIWGSDWLGSDEPFVILERNELVVVVSALRYAGYEGGLHQASAAYLEGPEEGEVGGRPALWAPGEVVVDAGGGVAFRVESATAERDVLAAVAERTALVAGPDDTVRPVVDRPPAGLRLTADVAVDAVVVRRAFVPDRPLDEVPGTSRTFAVGYRGPGGWLVAFAAPGGADDVRGLVRGVAGSTVGVDVAGRPATVVTESYGERVDRWLVTTGPAGDLVVVRVVGVPEAVLGVDDLVSVAAGIEPIDGPAWEAQVIEARGGLGLAPDPGAVELARGRSGTTDWLLQTLPSGAPDRLELRIGVDSCLRLAGGAHACATGVWGGAGFVLASGSELPFVVGRLDGEPAAVRVTTRFAQVEVPTIPAPLGEGRVFVAVLAGANDLTATTIEALDAGGAVLRRVLPQSD